MAKPHKDKIAKVKLRRCPTCGKAARIWYDRVGSNTYECNICCSNLDCPAGLLARGADVARTAERWNCRTVDDTLDDFVMVDGEWLIADIAKYKGSQTQKLF